MEWQDTMLVCKNGHVITDSLRASPSSARKHCDRCGAEAISTCQSCGASIPGMTHYQDVVALTGLPPAPKYCHNCGKPFPWTVTGVAATGGRPERRPQTGKVVVLMAMAKDDPALEDTFSTIRSACEDLKLRPWRADLPNTSGNVVDEVLEEIGTAELIIADLSRERPSVYYELGYADGIGFSPEEIVLVVDENSRVHFDLRNRRAPPYKNQTELRRILNERLGGYLAGRRARE